MEPQAQYPKSLDLATILFSLFLGTFLVATDTTIISVAIPEISTQFQALDDVGWYGSAYLITITALQPAGGTIYKFLNPKAVYLTAIVVFEAGSALCAAAPNSPVFILGRAVAGSGAALLLQGAISVITSVSELEKRPLYIGLVVSCFGICASLSPIIGGALTVRASWRWCFWINLPIGGVVFGLIALRLKLGAKTLPMATLPVSKKLKHLDPIGIITLLGSVSCLFLALQWGGSKSTWSSTEIIGLLVGSAALFVLFGVLQWWLGKYATIPLRMLRYRTLCFGAWSLFLISFSSNIKLYYIPFYFQAVRGGSALRSGVEFLALAVPQVVATVVAGALATKTGNYFSIMLGGTILCSVGTGLLIMLQTTTSAVSWVIFMVVAGFGDGLCTNMPYTAIQATFDNESDIFVGNAIATFATLAGGAIGISVGEQILISTLLSEVPKFTSIITPQAVIETGALNLTRLTSSPSVLNSLRQAYGKAISAVMICATVTICASSLTTLGMKPINLKKVTTNREMSNAGAQAESVPPPIADELPHELSTVLTRAKDMTAASET